MPKYTSSSVSITVAYKLWWSFHCYPKITLSCLVPFATTVSDSGSLLLGVSRWTHSNWLCLHFSHLVMKEIEKSAGFLQERPTAYVLINECIPAYSAVSPWGGTWTVDSKGKVPQDAGSFQLVEIIRATGRGLWSSTMNQRPICGT